MENNNNYESFNKLEKEHKFLTVYSAVGNQIAKDLKVDLKRLKKDIHSPKVDAKIKEDMAEAKKFNFQGTPGFIINGIPVKGAYPASHFDKIISKLQEKGKLVL